VLFSILTFNLLSNPNKTPNSKFVLEEIGKGTSIHEGLFRVIVSTLKMEDTPMAGLTYSDLDAPITLSREEYYASGSGIYPFDALPYDSSRPAVVSSISTS
jgi:hypothetical protein